MTMNGIPELMLAAAGMARAFLYLAALALCMLSVVVAGVLASLVGR